MAAFDLAKGIIAGWEAREKLTPSEPQIFVGEQLGPVLERLAGSAAPAAVRQAKP